MHRFKMLTFNRTGRMPKLMFVLGVLVLTLIAGGSTAAKRADAQSLTFHQIRVTFDSVKFTRINDCAAGGVNCNVAEVYGSLHVDSGGNTYLGEWGGGPCEAAWAAGDATGQCRKTVTSGTTFNFWETSLCSVEGAERINGSYCDRPGTWFVFSNAIDVVVYPGESVGVSAWMVDFDATVFDADDTVCHPSVKLPGFSLSQLQTGAQKSFTLIDDNPQNPHGACEIHVTLSALR